MGITELDTEERSIVMHGIRQFGRGGHPYPDEQNLNSFTSVFAAQCLRRVLKHAQLSAAERRQVEAIIEKLSATKTHQPIHPS